MNELLDSLLQSDADVGAVVAYAIICGMLLVSGLGVPIPEDIPLLTGGLLCQQGITDLGPMIVLTFVSVTGADLVLFGLGRRYGHHVPRLPMLRYFLNEQRIARAERYFEDHGGKTLFIARFLPGLRAPVYFSAGACRIPAWKMIAYDGSAALISAPTLVVLGYIGAHQFDRVKELALIGQILIAAAIVIAIAGLITYKVMRQKKIEPLNHQGVKPANRSAIKPSGPSRAPMA
ncbi:MAG: DedA family protein [Phycisphaeraceae bacterium]|nr:DedA family protein [Phycisphaeraceae bacterium]